MEVHLNTNDIESYRQFLAIKSLPTYRIRGHVATFPDEYAELVGCNKPRKRRTKYEPIDGLFDYQRDIAAMAIEKGKFSIFADCGLGKTLIFLEFARHAQAELRRDRKRVLIVSPLMVIPQTIDECKRFYGDRLDLEIVKASDLPEWTQQAGSKIGITNYDAMRDEVEQGNIGALILDESSMLKSHYGKWGGKCLELGRGIDWKMACTGTPAPNDRIEFANHAVFMDAFSSVNAFLATFFVNRGQTGERWELKGHALQPFYRALSHWCIFLTNPATYGWADNTEPLPPIHIHYHDVDLTAEQREIIGTETGELFATRMGGITSRSVLGQIAKGNYRGKPVQTNKPEAIRNLIKTFCDESCLIWCIYNAEQDRLAKEIPGAASIAGSTPHAERQTIIDGFKAGEIKIVISKPKILGFGLNLEIATRQIFSGLHDSYEEFYQAVKRSNRYGATRPLNVHIPLTDIEEPMISNVMRKAKRVECDAEEQERLFNASRIHSA
jgi:superfamily II DNA or RNA helicase